MARPVDTASKFDVAGVLHELCRQRDAYNKAIHQLCNIYGLDVPRPAVASLSDAALVLMAAVDPDKGAA